MKYNWKKIIQNQYDSGIPISSFYKNKRELSEVSFITNTFEPVEILNVPSQTVLFKINGNTLECDISILSTIIEALK